MLLLFCRARQLAQRSSAPAGAESIAQQLIRRREANAAAGPSIALPSSFGAGMTFNDTEEFSRSIAAQQDEKAAGAVKVEEGAGPSDAGGMPSRSLPDPAPVTKAEDYTAPMEEDIKDEDMQEAEEDHTRGNDWGNWVSAEEKEGAAAAAAERRRQRKAAAEAAAAVPPEEEVDRSGSLAVEQNISKGLGGILGLLKERGELKKGEEFAGRTNDTRDAYFSKAMGGYKDVFSGGNQDDRLAQSVEVALTRRDEYGRVLAPKEAFRQLCYKFHGIQPSKNTIEKREKQRAKELAQRKGATESAEGGSMAAIREAQKKLQTSYMVLSGNVRPGQSRDAASGYATVGPNDDDWDMDTDDTVPRLGNIGGGETPLTGNAKVEAMLGMKRPAGGSTSMPPPPPKSPRRN